ncbi:GNAT family N-acetyltransferase [Methanosphaera sp. BMS]|uniref:GNAT family N-acetyltransferase n=1 Tax=Methanosphaera sp. BMS TaxID=1789762 RepID=UPI000DC1F56B|nr:GNAT family N-acetyltransferase [Methanosphaera sp. BMS]AWX33229.1 hypothetical protein AW729_09075 [Methanosphaera sp. BMS]
MKIRFATTDDIKKMHQIYSYYIINTAVLFTDIIPNLKEFDDYINKIKEDYPVLVAEIDNKLVGYTYAKRIYNSKAYDYTVESSIYLDVNHVNKGIGSVLYSKLEEILIIQNVISINAYISINKKDDEFLDNKSKNFHKKQGFEEVSYLENWGYKFNKWYDCIWTRKYINPVCKPPKKFKSIKEVEVLIIF